MSNITLKEIKQPALLVFTANNCNTCMELNEILRTVAFNIINIDEKNGNILGPELSITAAPTSVLINNNIEIARFYGNKGYNYISNFLEENIS